MGWCSGTAIFDGVVEDILNTDIGEEVKVKIIRNPIVSLHDRDWDCEAESGFFIDPIVKKAFLKVNKKYWQSVYDEIESSEG